MISAKKLLTLASGLLFLTASLASAQDSNPGRKIDEAVKESLRQGGRTQHVILIVAPGCRANMLNALRQHGDVIKAEHTLIDALSAEIHSEDAEELAKHPCVTAVAADADVVAEGAPKQRTSSTTTVSTQTSSKPLPNVLRQTLGLSNVAGSGDMTGATGLGVVIIDSGIAPSANFLGRITGFYDFTNGGVSTPPFDDYGHGTHIAGLIGSSGKLSNYEYQGIAPEVKLIGLKVLDGTGVGRTSDVISAIEFAILNKSKLNAHMMNISLGHPIYAPAKYDPLVLAVEKASAAGYIVVVSGGNFGQARKNGEPGYTGITSPGNAPSAITVGAAMTEGTVLREDDRVAPYSGRGPTWFDAFAKPDVVAPGHKLVSDTSVDSYLYQNLPANRRKASNGQTLLELSGTSMGTAVTSGVVALVLQQHNQNGMHRQKALTANLVKAMLQFSAIPIAGADYLTQGAGEINAVGAISLAKGIDTSEKVGEWWLATSVTPYSTIGGTTYAWSQHVIWGDTVLTGDLLYYNLAPWSVGAADEDNIIWGTDDDNIIWGTHALVDDDNIIWGTTEVWAANLVWSDRIIGQDDGDNIIWGTDDDNIIWGTLDFDNIIWGTWDGDNIIWGTWEGDNIIWGTDDNIIWGTYFEDDNIIWGTFDEDNVIWGTDDDNVIWGTVFMGSD
jgi:serine protease AprX